MAVYSAAEAHQNSDDKPTSDMYTYLLTKH